MNTTRTLCAVLTFLFLAFTLTGLIGCAAPRETAPTPEGTETVPEDPSEAEEANVMIPEETAAAAEEAEPAAVRFGYEHNALLIDEGQCGDSVYWQFYEDGRLAVFGEGPMWDYKPTGRGKEVTAPWEVYKDGLASLELCEGVTSVGNYAFAACGGFTGSLTLPSTLKSIGNEAFSYCSGFTGSLTIPDGVEEIQASAFNKCTGIEGSLTLPSSLKKIGMMAFNRCTGFTGSLTIPDGTEEIGMWAFMECRGFAGELTIPDSVTDIGHGAFEECVGLSGNLTIGSGVKTIKDHAFSGCRGVTRVTVGEHVEKLESCAFQNCTALEDMYFYGSAPEMHHDAFLGSRQRIVIHYPAGGFGWTDPWNGFETEEFEP